MADLFQSLNTTQSPLDGVDLSQPAPETNINNQTADRTARLGAIVQSGLGSTDTSYFDQLGQTTQEYKQQIAQYGDAALRNQVAADSQAKKVRQFAEFSVSQNEDTDPDGSLRTGAALAAQGVLSEDIQQRSQYALEQEAVDRIQDLAGSDPVQAEVLKHNFEDGDTNSVIRDFSTKQLILQREIENAGIQEHDQSWVADLADFAMSSVQNLVPFTRPDIGNVNMKDVEDRWYDSLFSGERKQAEASSLWNMPVSQFSDFVKSNLLPAIQKSSTFLGYKNNGEILSTLSEFQHPGSVTNQNVADFANNLGLIAGLKGPLKAVVSLPSLLVRQGARDAAVATIADAMKTATTDGLDAATTRSGLSKDDLLRSVSPTAINAGPQVSTVPVAGDVNLAYARGQELLNTISDLQQPGRFKDPQEFQDVLNKNIKRINDQYSANALVKDVRTETETLTTGQKITHLVTTLGNKTSGGFATQEEAESFARSLGLPSGGATEVPYPRVQLEASDQEAVHRMEWESVRDDSGQYFVQLRSPMRETGFYSNPLAPQATNSLSRFFLNARKVSDEWLQNLAQVSGNTRQRIGAALSNKVKTLNSLSQDELSSLGQVLQYGQNNRVWLSDDELRTAYSRAFGREPSVKEVTAYHDYQDLNDMEFALRTDERYSQLHLRGYKTVSIATQDTGIGRVNGIVDREMKTVPQERVFDTSDRVHYNSKNPLTQDQLDKLRGDGRVLVSLEQPFKLQDGTYVKHFLVNPRDLEEEALSRFQVGYSPGGHRIYSDPVFVKQAREIVQPDTKTRQFVNPNTFINAPTMQEAKLWAEKMETARLLARQGADSATLDKLFRGDAGFPSGQEFLDGVKDGTYSLEHPFEAVWDRQLPSAYHETGANLEYVDQERPGQNGLLEAQGRMYYGPKGEQLPDFRGQLAPTLDPYKTLDLALQNISKLTSFADYKQAAVERWATTFRRYTNLANESSDWKVFSQAQIGRDVPENIRQGALAQRDVIQRILGHESEFDYQTKQYYNRISEWVAGNEDNKVRSLLAKAVNWWSTKDPASSIRGLVFDAKMGFWNPVQVPIHLGNMYAALTLGGAKKGMAALIGRHFLESYLTKAGTEEWLDHVVSTGNFKKMGFGTADEFKTAFRYMKSSGMMNIGDANNLINEFGPSASISAFSNGVDRLRESGRTLLHWTWRQNKIVAAHLAWQDTREQFPKLAYDSQEFLNKFAGRTEEYDLNFSRESRAAWQKGWTSIPTQFFGYWTALADAALGKQFSPQARARLVLGQLFLSGSAGIPVISALDSFYSSQTGNGAHPDTFWGNLRRGALDDVIYHVTGADVKAGARLGVGDEATNLIQEIFGFGENGDKSLADVFGGASYSVVKAFGKSVGDVIGHVASETGADNGNLTRDSILRVADQINTVNNVTKALQIFKYHTILSANGSVLAQDLPTVDGFAQAIGFQPEEQDYMSNLLSWSKNQKDVVNDAVKQLDNMRTRFVTEPDKRQEIAADINTFMQLLPADVRLKAIKEANTRTPMSIYKSLGQQYQKDMQQKQMIENVQGSK